MKTETNFCIKVQANNACGFAKAELQGTKVQI